MPKKSTKKAAAAPPAPVAAAEAPTIPLTGPEAILHALSKLNVDDLEHEAKSVLDKGQVSKRPRAVAVLNAVRGFRRNGIEPKDLMIQNVPVIPPAFRPYAIAGSTFIPGDANELYRDLLELRDGYDSARGLLGDAATGDDLLALYDSVKAVQGYGDPVKPKTKARGVNGFLKKIIGTGGPKTGWLQRKMISKTLDNVARGVITVDPELGMDEIAVPRDMAWTAYKNHIQRALVQSGMRNADALRHIKDRSEEADRAFTKVREKYPMRYSRAPAWHKFSNLAGWVKLIDGHNIAINPLVTTGLNADFDGDQMNLHVPIADDVVEEAKELLLPSKMLFSVRDQNKVMPVPKHEHILGLYAAQKRPAKRTHVFATEDEAIKALERGLNDGSMSLQDEITIGKPVPAPAAAPAMMAA